MDREEIRAGLAEILKVVSEDKPIDLASVGDDTMLRDGLGLDSLQVTEMLFEIEERLGAKIEDEEAMQLRTVGDLIALIERKRQSG